MSGADPTLANSVLSVDLGKPTITEGECTVDISTIILGLAPGDYIATVTAVGSGTSAPTAIHAVTTLMRPSAILSTLCAQPRTNSSS